MPVQSFGTNAFHSGSIRLFQSLYVAGFHPKSSIKFLNPLKAKQKDLLSILRKCIPFCSMKMFCWSFSLSWNACKIYKLGFWLLCLNSLANNQIIEALSYSTAFHFHVTLFFPPPYFLTFCRGSCFSSSFCLWAAEASRSCSQRFSKAACRSSMALLWLCSAATSWFFRSVISESRSCSKLRRLASSVSLDDQREAMNRHSEVSKGSLMPVPKQTFIMMVNDNC